MGNPPMSITIAIPTCGRAASLQRLLDAVALQTRQPDEVLVIDASKPLSKPEVPSAWEFSHLSSVEPNLPFQRWEGVSRAQGEIIAFLDDDVVPEAEYLERICRRYQSDERNQVGGIGGWLVDQPGSRSSLGRSIRHRLSGLKGHRQGVVLTGGLISWWVDPPECEEIVAPCLSGGAMSFRTSVLKSIGPQPWLYDCYRQRVGRAEDLILSALVRRAGYQLLLLPSNRLVHHAGEAGSAYARGGYAKALADTWVRYLGSRLVAERWGYWDQVAFLRYVCMLVASNVVHYADWGYARGAVRGLIMCARAAMPSEVSASVAGSMVRGRFS